jgi:uncharacterized membrane protein YkoI
MGILAGALLVSFGCGDTRENDVPIPFEKVPPELLKVAQEKFPDVKFDSAYKETKDGQEVYEVRGKTKQGKIREVEVTADGKVLQVD